MSNLLRCGLSRFSRGLFPSTSVFLFMLMHSTGLHQNFCFDTLPSPAAFCEQVANPGCFVSIS